MRVPATYLKLYLEHFAEQPQVSSALLAGTGLDVAALASSDRYLPLATVLRVLQNAHGQFDAGWHVRLAAEMEIVQHGPLGFAAATAADVNSAIRVLARFVEVRAPFAWLQISHRGERVRIGIYETVELGPLRTSLMETALLACANIVRHVAAHGEPGIALELPGPAPEYADAFRTTGLAEPQFNSAGYSVSLPAHWLDRPCLLYDRSMHEASVAKCRDLVATTSRRSDLEFAIRELLHAAGGRSPGLPSVAAALNLSPRSLIRHLKQDDTSFRAIVESVHKTLAREWLKNTGTTVAEIGYRLGYANPSNFGRAFRQWFGVSAGRYRTMSLSGQSPDAHGPPAANRSRDPAGMRPDRRSR